jgi:hypothetical protein
MRSSATTDLTMPAEVAEGAERLITSAERDGGIMLAELSQAELCALRAEIASMVCERTCRWWVRLGAARRQQLGRMALELMVTRGFLHPPPGTDAAEMYESGQLTNEHLAPELAIILAARTSPRPLVACQVPGLDASSWCHPRFFGITGPGRELRALLCEVLTSKPAGLRGQPVFGTILRYTLMTPGRTARMITSWAGLFADGAAHGGPPTVTLLAHGDAGMLDQEHFQIRPESGIFTVTRTGPDGRPGEAVTLDETGTIMEMTAALTRMAQ